MRAATICGYIIATIAVFSLLCISGCSDGLHSLVVSRSVDHRPMVLIFHAEWCPFCPTKAEIARLTEKYRDKAVIVGVDVDEQPELKKKYHVTRIPWIVFCNGEQCMPTGDMRELQRWLDEL